MAVIKRKTSYLFCAPQAFFGRLRLKVMARSRNLPKVNKCTCFQYTLLYHSRSKVEDKRLKVSAYFLRRQHSPGFSEQYDVIAEKKKTADVERRIRSPCHTHGSWVKSADEETTQQSL